MATKLEASGDSAVAERGVDAGRHRETVAAISRQVHRHARITFNEMKVASKAETDSLLKGLNELQRNPGKVNEWEGFIEWSEKAIQSSTGLRRQFESELNSCVAAGTLSEKWKNQWIKEKFENPSVGYKQREDWVKHELPAVKKKWAKTAQEREQLAKDPNFADLVSYDSKFAVIGNKTAFLDLHIDTSMNLLAEGRAVILSVNKMQGPLYAEAKAKLEDARDRGIMSPHKVGVWLERIFKSNADPKKIEAFVKGSGTKSLEGLKAKWEQAAERFDTIDKKFKERWDSSGIRGFQQLSRSQFLSLHYAQRLQYLDQAADRLDEANDVKNEAPILLKLRHAMDMKDWEDAGALIVEAKMSQLSERDFKRLKSMESYVKQFSGSSTKETSAKGIDAQKRIGELVQRMEGSHSEMVPLVKRLLKSPHPNRGMHQLRWITYNNIWCRTHGGPYLDDDIARKGASEQQAQETKYKAEHGEDIGRNDSLSHSTSEGAYFRKEETAKHKATYLHTNMSAGGVVSALGEKMERELDPKLLYWTTFCPHTNGDPKSEEWMRELMANLGELRSLTRTTETELTLEQRSKIGASETSLSTAA